MNILHVNTNKSDHERLKNLLESMALSIDLLLAESNSAALGLIENEQISAVISDNQPPVINGLELLEHLQKRNDSIPFIFLTDSGDERLAVDAFRSGAVDYFTMKEGFAEEGSLTESLQKCLLAERVTFSKPIAHNPDLAEYVEAHAAVFFAIIEQCPLSIAISALDGRMEYVNAHMIEQTGYTFEEHRGNRPSMLRPDDYPETVYRELWNTISSGNIWTGILPCKRKNGEIFWENTTVFPQRDSDGNIAHMVAIKEDITQRLIDEKRLEVASRIIESSDVATFLWKNEEGWPVEYVSWNVENLVGYLPDQLMSGEVVYTDLIHKDDLERVGQEVASFSENAEVSVHEHVPYRIICSDGSEKIVSDKTNVIRDTDGNITHYQGIIEDISERTLIESNLDQAYKDLQEAHDGHKAFSHTVAHDLRAPLRHIGAYSAILHSDYNETLDEDGQDILSEIGLAVSRMEKLIEDIMKFSDTSQKTIVSEDVHLSPKAMLILEKLKKLSPERKIKCEIAEDLFAKGDSALLSVVLENLLGNAWKFTLNNENAAISFRSEIINGKTTYIVSDNGAGFEQRFAERIFTPFERLHTDQKYKGTGIGLATVHSVISRHGGNIWATSEPEKGASFFFTLE